MKKVVTVGGISSTPRPPAPHSNPGLSVAPLPDTRLLQMLLDSAPIVLFAIDQQGIYLMSEGRGLTEQGLAPSALVGTCIFDLVRDYPAYVAEIRRALAGEDVDCVFETFGRTLERRLRPVRGPSGEVTSVMGIAIDVTATYQAMESLRERELDFRNLAEGAQEGIVIVQDKKIVFTNSAMAKLLGYAHPAELLRLKSYEEIIPEDEIAVVRDRYNLRLAGGAAAEEYELGAIHRDGIRIVMRVRALRITWQRQSAVQYTCVDITQLKKAEVKEQRMEHLLLRAQQAGQLGLWVRDLATDELSWSPEVYRICGLDAAITRADFDTYAQLVHREDRERFVADKKRIMTEGGSMRQDHRLVTPMGELRHVHFAAERIDMAGKPLAIVGVVQDVTDRAEAESVVREKEWLLSRAAELAHVGTWFGNADAGEMRWSPEIFDMCGVPQDSFQPTFANFLRMLHPEDRQPFHLARKFARKNGGKLSMQVRIVRPDGAIRHVQVLGERLTGSIAARKAFVGLVKDITKVPDPEKESHIVGVMQDVTDREESNAALREKEWILSRAAEVGNLGTWYRDIASGKMTWSNEVYGIFGVVPETFDPTTDGYFRLIHPEDRDHVVRQRQARAQDGQRFEENTRIIRPDGQVRHVHVIGEGVRSSRGKLVGLIGIVQDVTRQKQDEDRLLQAQKQEAMGRLTSGIAHDFNNLLTILQGNLELLKDDIEDESPSGKRLETLLQTTARGADLIRRMSVFNRKRALQNKVVSPRNVIDGLQQLLPRMLGVNITLETSVAEDVANLYVDGAQLESALVNMAVNARDAMPNGGRLIYTAKNVKFDQPVEDAPPGEYVMITVSDTGTGMPKSVLNRIFEPFFTTKEPGKGSGLGLSMVYGFVKQCGGWMRVYSEVGKGTSFRLHFPVHRGATVVPQAAEAAAAQNTAWRVSGPVLLVEDEPDIRAVAESILARMGLRWISCGDAKKALEIVRQQPDISLLFTDVMLPNGLSGLELVDQVWKLRPGLPTLITSGFAEQLFLLEPLLAKGAAFLEKPYQVADLQTLVRTLLTTSGAHPPDRRVKALLV